jgi:outer membrane protein assembly factor BamD (BamD/ComL family)
MALRFAFGLFVLLLFVAGVAWCIWRSLKNSHDPARLAFRWLLTVGFVVGAYFTIDHVAGDGSAEGKIGGVILGLLFGLVFAALWVPAIAGKVGEWFGNLYTGGGAPPELTALYSIAESRRKQGRYGEAVREIRAQLARFPTDVTGHIMLAEIQAEHLDDLPGAQHTIERFIAQPGHGPKNIAFALNSLADWHLKNARDLESARQALEKIVELLPDTDLAMSASQRLAHLADADAVNAVHERRLIRMRTGAMDIGLGHGPSPELPKELTPEEAAERLVKQLEAHPLDADSREKLAGIYFEHYDRTDLAIEQLEQLIQAPNQPAREVARWLNLIADWQVKKKGADYEAIHATLQRIVDRFPGLAAAQLAQQRLELLRLELKGKEEGHSVKLGAYEKDLGLKRGKPG